MAEAMTAPTKGTAQILMMIVSFMLALPLAAILLIYPSLMLDANGHYNHSVLMLVMLGISGGFIYGVGFVPQFWLWKWLFNPIVAWPLMAVGYYLWLG
ncbi:MULTISPECIES: cyd operon YbgE family protein [Acinetobacter]|jgi:predicted membrane protein|uniref:cyd operon YbgE family protein n=1 Tax=Acinetobacter TaxID=469 RepID=UPI00124E8826|nr:MULTISPECIES: cyd operon YbgE family protein [Acinetobacter]MCG2574555.1 cyd operon YbgE family protein [Acinetobacter sp. ME22]